MQFSNKKDVPGWLPKITICAAVSNTPACIISVTGNKSSMPQVFIYSPMLSSKTRKKNMRLKLFSKNLLNANLMKETGILRSAPEKNINEELATGYHLAHFNVSICRPCWKDSFPIQGSKDRNYWICKDVEARDSSTTLIKYWRSRISNLYNVWKNISSRSAQSCILNIG